MLNKPLFRDWLGISFPSSSEDIPFPLCGCKIDIRKWWMMMVHLWVWVQTPIHPCPDINSSYFLVQFLKYLSSSFFPVPHFFWFLPTKTNGNQWWMDGGVALKDQPGICHAPFATLPPNPRVEASFPLPNR